ncbi:MAG: SH3 domain-containing protein [Spirochaetales bacterium]|nr:SH3 domain-containing protein [Spirochaetales bacterium]MCP5485157.1 SH3 domain-containing protein [Spirochaetales bacterium]
MANMIDRSDVHYNRKNRFALLSVVGLALVLMALSPGAESGQLIVVRERGHWLRVAPDFERPVLRWLAYGTRLRIVEDRRTPGAAAWVRVVSNEGESGWTIYGPELMYPYDATASRHYNADRSLYFTEPTRECVDSYGQVFCYTLIFDAAGVLRGQFRESLPIRWIDDKAILATYEVGDCGGSTLEHRSYQIGRSDFQLLWSWDSVDTCGEDATPPTYVLRHVVCVAGTCTLFEPHARDGLLRVFRATRTDSGFTRGAALPAIPFHGGFDVVSEYPFPRIMIDGVEYRQGSGGTFAPVP